MGQIRVQLGQYGAKGRVHNMNNMNQKQNYKYLAKRVYSDYFGPAQQHPPAPRQHRTKQDRKIESKLKAIIANLDGAHPHQHQNYQTSRIGLSRQSSIHSKPTLRSYSEKSLHAEPHSHAQPHGGRSRLATEFMPAGYGYRGDQDEGSTNQFLKNYKNNLVKAAQGSRQELPAIKQPGLRKLRVDSLSVSRKPGKQGRRQRILTELESREFELGKAVLEKVERHFQQEKHSRKHYYDRVKSEENIDTTLISYLKNKIKRADIVLGG